LLLCSIFLFSFFGAHPIITFKESFDDGIL